MPTGVASDIIRNSIWLFVFSSLVPSLPPSNVIAQAVNLSSIFVRWDPIPAEGRNGIIIGYKAWYRKMVEPPVWKRMKFCNVYWCEATNLDNLLITHSREIYPPPPTGIPRDNVLGDCL